MTRPDKSSPTNMQFIIDAFKPKEDKPPKPFDVQVNTVVVRKSSISYDVLDQPCKPGAFDTIPGAGIAFFVEGSSAFF